MTRQKTKNNNDNGNDYNGGIGKDVLFWSTVRQARAIRDGVFTSRDLLELMITQIDAINPIVNTIVTLDLEEARLAADTADAQITAGADVGPLPEGFERCGSDRHREDECSRRLS